MLSLSKHLYRASNSVTMAVEMLRQAQYDRSIDAWLLLNDYLLAVCNSRHLMLRMLERDVASFSRNEIRPNRSGHLWAPHRCAPNFSLLISAPFHVAAGVASQWRSAPILAATQEVLLHDDVYKFEIQSDKLRVPACIALKLVLATSCSSLTSLGVTYCN